VTRLWRRAGSGPLTGIDRVERAYLREFLARPEPVFGIVTKGMRHWILSRAGLEPFAHSLELGSVAALCPKLVGPGILTLGLAAAVGRTAGPAVTYYNVGHIGASAGKLRAIAQSRARRVVCMVHDTIPLDFPQFSGPGAGSRFRSQLEAMSRHATLLVCNSDATGRALSRHIPASRLPPTVVAHLGVELAEARPSELPPGLPPAPPYFVAVGTIEPRKNLGLLLDVWDRIAEAGPETSLVIAGRPGWASPDLFSRIRAARNRAAPVIHVPDLSDGALRALLGGARALLMPSLAEGYGLPVAEAAATGTTVVAADLPVYREIVGDYPIYLDSGDRYAWHQTITRLVELGGAEIQAKRISVPDWDGHFKTVLSHER